jgi:chaperonin GroEL (HSP60 family)
MPKKIEDAKSLYSTRIEVKETEVDAEIRITDPAQMQAFIERKNR